jgi:hypothetical protein
LTTGTALIGASRTTRAVISTPTPASSPITAPPSRCASAGSATSFEANRMLPAPTKYPTTAPKAVKAMNRVRSSYREVASALKALKASCTTVKAVSKTR